MQFALFTAFVIVAGYALATRQALAAPSASGGWMPDFGQADEEPDQVQQLPDLIDLAMAAVSPSSYSTGTLGASQADANVRAFLDAIAWAEGAKYNTLFGGGTFASYADHPRQLITRTSNGRPITSSAAGRYQFLRRTWDALAARLQLPDFSPASQDAAAIELIRERGALGDVQAGRFAAAVAKVRTVWASLPGAGYDQPEKQLTDLAQVFAQAGGIVTA